MNEWYDWAFKGMVGIIGLLLTAWSTWLMNAVSKNREYAESIEDMQRRHELEDARTYVTDLRFRETVAEMKDTAKRTYDKIDSIFTILSRREP